MALYDGNGNTLNIVGSASSNVYRATDYGISVDAEDNTPALQALVNLAHNAGGGVIFFPVGTYNFKNVTDTTYAILAKSNVSIIGENIQNTIFKKNAEAPYALFYYKGTSSIPITGCTYSNFTIDGYSTGDTWNVAGKGFFYQYVKNCVFRDIVLQGTIATAMGIDFLDQVVIDNITCIDCGRLYTSNVYANGSSGIGIGTGGWDDENFTISNCVCVGSGQFGIFIENQYVLNWGGNVDTSKGCIISNCVVRNGDKYGIGVQSGKNVTVIGCESYENASNGFCIGGKCQNVKIIGCSSAENSGNGIEVSVSETSENVVIFGNTIAGNVGKGINVAPTNDVLSFLTIRNNNIFGNAGGVVVSKNIANLALIGNYTADNGTNAGISLGAVTLADCVVNGNVSVDGHTNNATFTGNTALNDYTTA